LYSIGLHLKCNFNIDSFFKRIIKKSKKVNVNKNLYTFKTNKTIIYSLFQEGKNLGTNYLCSNDSRIWILLPKDTSPHAVIMAGNKKKIDLLFGLTIF